LARQNRVTPFGTLIATDARGTLMGNRGCLHDDQQRIRRAFAGKRWILCLLQFKGRRRTVMTPGQYTELFFLDEATGLAAGHRPCAECQRKRFLLFRETWMQGSPELVQSATPPAEQIDAVLHAERLGPDREKRTYDSLLAPLPCGTMVVIEGEEAPVLVLKETIVPWSAAGYGPPRPRPSAGRARVLTPPSIVRALAAGYPVEIHPSAQ
jgi:hypothetical protein